MSIIKPFRAVYYNEKKVKDLRKVVSPPYDIISDEEQDRLHNLSPYNFTHIDYGKDKPKDTKEDNKYTRAKDIFHDWLEKNVMLQDEEPSIYFYRQDYKILGQKYSRMGFVSLLELKDDHESKVRPHENTHSHAVNDRLMLTKSLNSNLSSIFVCFSDKNRRVEKIFNKNVAVTQPLLEVEDDDRIKHKIWRLSDPELIKEVNDNLEDQHLFIADGHHRYKVACEYRQFRIERKQTTTKQEPFNYVMTYFTNLDSKNLQIFPMHRIVTKFPNKFDLLEEYFRIDKIRNKDELVILLARAGKNEHAFGLYTKDGAKLLRLKNKLLIDKIVKEGSDDYKKLDATILKCFVFDKLGIKSDDIMYTKDLQEVTDKVATLQAQAGFIMNPVKITQLKAIALNGERMPPKTTYFYPKVLSGLTVYKVD